MEESLDRVLAQLLQKQGTTGAMVVDRNGLALALKGVASERAAGAARLLADRAKLLGDDGQTPAVCIETDGGSVLLEEQQNFTVVLWRTNETK